MSWVNDLASAAGIPAGAATLAVAMYVACGAAEKAARPEALKDIGRILKDTTWERSVRPSAIIEEVFNWTFGEQQLSWQCLTRSAYASSIILLCLVLIFRVAFGVGFGPLLALHGSVPGAIFPQLVSSPIDGAIQVILGFLVMAVFPDYLALGKTRLLVRSAHGHGSFSEIAFLVTADIFFSVAISFLFAVAVLWSVDTLATWHRGAMTLALLDWAAWVELDIQAMNEWVMSATPGGEGILGAAHLIFRAMVTSFMERRHLLSLLPLFLCSTLFTSVWTILILLSTSVLKLFAPVHRFTAWFFDVEKHPVHAIGIVAGALVMAGSIIWTVLRAVI